MRVKRWLKTWGIPLVAILALGASASAICLDYAHFKESLEVQKRRYEELNRQYEESLQLSRSAIELEKQHYEELKKQYEEAIKPHTQHDEIYNRLIILDSKIERAEEWIYVWQTFGEDTRDLDSSLRTVESLRHQAEKAWDHNQYGEADKLISKAYDVLDEISVPAALIVSDLTITPAEVDIRETVTISVRITNPGDLVGSYEATLKIDDVTVATEEVTLAGGASQKVTFTTAKDVLGTYTVTIDTLSGTFTVKVPPMPPVPPKPINQWLYGGIIAACIIIIGIAVWLTVRRRRRLVNIK